MPKRNLQDIELTDKTILVALDGVEKPGNLGAILRTLRCCGCVSYCSFKFQGRFI